MGSFLPAFLSSAVVSMEASEVPDTIRANASEVINVFMLFTVRSLGVALLSTVFTLLTLACPLEAMALRYRRNKERDTDI